jgi:hypothetical protein
VRKKKTARAKEPSAGDYLATLGDVLFVNPRNSAAATLGGAAYDYAVKSTPRSVVRDITESAEDAGDWLRKEGKLIRAAPVTESLRLLKAGFIDPLADPYRVFKQAATERARGNEVGGKKLAAMVPLAVAGVLPQGRGASKVATKAGVEAAETATKAATKTAKKTATKPKASKMTVTPKASTEAPAVVAVKPPAGLRTKIEKTMGPSATKAQIETEYNRMLDAYAAGEKKPPLPKPLQARPYTPQEQAVYDKFGSKQDAEAARKGVVEETADVKKSRKVLDPEDRFKVEPTKYRDLEAEEGPDAVLDAVRRGEHLKQTEAGYVGAPRTVTGPLELTAMRANLDDQFGNAVNAINLADPQSLGTWYDRARMGQAASNEPYMLPRVLEEHGVYSAGVSPESELGFALKHRNSRALGEPTMAFRTAPMNTLDEAVANNVPADLGDKIGEYAKKQDPRNPGKSLFGVNDFRAAQTFGYTDAQGNPWKDAVSGTMHPLMDAETALMVDRLNTSGLGGRTDWRGEQIQEVPWIYGKGQDLYSRGYGFGARFAGEPIEGITMALREANKSPAEFMPKHAASATYEIAPGASTGHVPEYFTWSPEKRAAYDAQGLWAQEAPEMATQRLGIFGPSGEVPAEVGAGPRDVLYGALGMRQLPSIESSGSYRNSRGELEGNKMYMPRPLIDFPTGGGGKMTPLTQDAMDLVEHFRALNDAQEAYAVNLPNTTASAPNKSGILLETTGDLPIGEQLTRGSRQPTSEQLAALSNVLKPVGDDYVVSATNRGAFVIPTSSDATEKSAEALLDKYGPQLGSVLDAEPKLATPSSIYGPALGRFDENYNIVPTAPYSGEATMAFLEKAARLPEKMSLDISESEAGRSALRQKYLRDLALKNDEGVGYRGDIQNMRQFFSEANWPKAVELIRKGLSPAAAIAALGYSASAMAEEPEE